MIDKTKIPYLYEPYPIRKISEFPRKWPELSEICEHKHAQFQGMYSLIGHYHCPCCKSRFCPQEFQNR